uniref:Type IV secretion system protein VirB6 n=1 Tax=Vibrio crassostreae TaxID=246167 RepID=A0A0H3ZXH5_9VIBR|nr:hypothetical protein [Vibrio crassostreae]
MDTYDIIEIMESAPTIGDIVINYFDYVLMSLIAEKYKGLNEAMHTLLFSVLLMVILIKAILGMTGRINVIWREIITTTVLLLLAMEITEPETYRFYIMDTASSLSGGLGSYFVGNGNGTTFESINGLFTNLFSLISRVTDAISWQDFASLILIYGLGGVFAVLYFMFVIVLIYAKFAMTILLLLGGVILQISAFKSMRGVAKSWIQSLCKYGVSIIIATVIIVVTSQLCIVCFNKLVDVITLDNSIEPDDLFGVWFWLLALVGAVAVFLMMKVMELTSEMTGGVATDMSQSFNAAANTANAALAPIRMIGSGVKKKFGS